MNVKTTKNKKYIDLAYRASVAKQKADAAKKVAEDLMKELKAFNGDMVPLEWLTVPYTIVNGFTSEMAFSQTVQKRSQYSIEAICSDLRVPALTVENGYRTPQPVICSKVGVLTAVGF